MGSDRGKSGLADTTLEDIDAPHRLRISDLTQAVTSPAARRGLIALAGGIVFLAWPGLTTVAIVAIVAVALLLIGGSDLVASARGRKNRGEWVRSALMVLAGASLLVFRGASFRWIAVAVGVVLIGRGLIDVIAAARGTGQGRERVWWLIRGAAQILAGGITIVSPRTVVLAVMAIVAAAWIIAGLLNLFHALNRDTSDDAPIAARDTPQAAVDWLRERDMGTDERRLVIEKLIFEGPAFRARVARFVALMLFATAIATFGVQADSTAVVIGAMLIAPLMTPIMATAASLLMGWPGRAIRSFALVVGGVLLAVGTSWVLARYAPQLVSVTANTQVLGRVSPTLLDLLVAVAAGAAGAYAVSRTDVSDSLPGVAISVALVPPLTVVGISLQAGQFTFATGAFLLFLTNLVGIVLAGGIVFVLVGFSPWFHLETNQQQVNRSFAAVGVALLLISIPLAITGDDIVTGVTDQATAEEAVDEWLPTQSPFDPARVSVDGSTVVVVLVGSGELPIIDHLAARLATDFDREVTLDLRVLPEERTTVTAIPEETN